ncbi:MAG: di-trans,poly-cis-decaprenylcistransferase [Bacteroidales bacterium]|nr:di-trans,poly-cis-decaprenylcistransferase [Bacteroidales bacterium]
MTRIPTHVSIIMDGNGRWAKAQGKERFFGHIAGVETVRRIVESSIEQGVKYLSLFAFSTENWGRPSTEVSSLMELMVKSMVKEVPALKEQGVRFVVLGDRGALSVSMNETIDKYMESTAGCSRLTLIIMLSYSGKWDIIQAVNKLRLKEKITEEDIAENLVTAGFPDPDLIIRTSGEERLSNYFLWQGAYSELYFTKVLWPDFSKEDYVAALEEYSRRDRRFGKV